MLSWSDIRSIDSIHDPLGVLSVYADRPDRGGGRLVRAVALAGELRRLEADVDQDGHRGLAAAYRECLVRIRPALSAMLDGRSAGRALFAPLSSEEVFEIGVGLPMGVTTALERTAYVRPLVAAFDEGRAAGVMVADGASVQLFQWRMGSVEEVGEYRFTGGALAWRRRGWALAAGLARDVHDIAADRRWTRVLVAGDGRLAHALAATRAATDREVSMVTRPLGGLRPRAIAAVIGSDLHAAQREYELRLVERVVQAAARDRSAVLGLAGAVRALEERRVGHLLFDGERDYHWSGAMARRYGGWPRRDPAEALIELALHAGADITPVEGASRRLLTGAGGIAAGLRSMLDADGMLATLDGGLGGWAYALVAALAFLETSAFVGLLAPGELAVVLGGVLAGRGHLQLPLLVAVVWAAAFAGDTCGYLLGRSVGRGFAIRHGRRFGLTQARLARVEAFVARHGVKAIVIGRFVGVIRALGPFTAGASGMGAGRFLAADLAGAGAWAATFTTLGYVFAWRVGALLDGLHHAQVALAAVLAIALAGVVLTRWRRRLRLDR